MADCVRRAAAKITNELAAPPEAVIDGELGVLDPLGMPLFNRLWVRIVRRCRPPHRAEPETAAIFAFDLLSVHGEDLRAQPLIERKDALQRLLRKCERIRYLQHAGGRYTTEPARIKRVAVNLWNEAKPAK